LKKPKISIYHTGYKEEDFKGIYQTFGKENVRIFNNEPKRKKEKKDREVGK
jgi:hypothetical protein